MTAFNPFERQVFIANDYIEGSGGTLDVVNPSTFEREGALADCDATTIERAVKVARGAQKQWAATDAKSRAAALHRVAQSIAESDPKPVCTLMTREVGKPYPESVGEVMNVAPIFRYYAELARDDAGRIAGPIQSTTFQFMRYDPLGVSAHICPYNFPILIFAFTAAASLAAGNAVILKPSEVASLCSLRFMEHFRHLPPGLVGCLTGGGAVGAHLVDSPDIDAVAFTGSVETARKVNIACAGHMKPCVIEAGGNDPMIVTDSVDPDFAAAACTTAAFHLSGQICTSSERFYVHEKIHDAFLKAFVQRTRNLRIGDGFARSEIGPLATEAARERVARLVGDAIAQGAKLACGGRIPPGRNTGWYYEPTILTDCTPEMAILNGEIFGPVAPICRVRSTDEAIELANRSAFGLGASILTTDMGEALKASERLESGMVWVNNPLVDNDALPFGGRKFSGVGRELGREGLNAFRHAKAVTIDPVPIHADWWYPYPDDWFYETGGRS